MPLSMVKEGEPGTVVRISGKDEVRQFLEKLGVVVGTKVTVVSAISGNLILRVKDARVAIGKEMANKILVTQ